MAQVNGRLYNDCVLLLIAGIDLARHRARARGSLGQ